MWEISTQAGAPGIQFSKTIAPGRSFRFAVVGSLISSSQAENPPNGARRLTIFASAQGLDRLVAAHESAWAQNWNGDILLRGDDDSQRVIHSLLFHLYSLTRAGSDCALAPYGLSSTLCPSGRGAWARRNPSLDDAELTLERIANADPVRRPPLVLLVGGFLRTCFGRLSHSVPSTNRQQPVRLLAPSNQG